MLAQAGFTKVTLVAATTEPIDAVVDTVISINPVEGALVAKSTPITVTYATGKSPFPDLSGFSQAAAVQGAKDAGFTNVSVKERVPTAQESANGSIAVGTVIDTDPKAKAVADRTTPVTIFIAKAAPATPPPSSASAPSAPNPACTPTPNC